MTPRRPNPAPEYRAELLRRANDFGIDRALVQSMQHPVLVRVIDGLSSEAPKAELTAAVRRFNEGLTQQLSPQARAVAEAKALTPAAMESLGELLAGAGDASLRDVLRESPREVLEILSRNGIVNPQNRGQWVQGNGLSDEAKDRIEGMFLGKVVGTGERLSAASPSVLAKLERATPALVRVAGINNDLDEIPRVQAALDLLADASNHGITLSELLLQGELGGVGNNLDRSDETVKMAALLSELGPRAVGERFKKWAARAAQDPNQGTMFGKPATKPEAESVLFGRIQNPAAMPVYANPFKPKAIAKEILEKAGGLPRVKVVLVISPGNDANFGQIWPQEDGTIKYRATRKGVWKWEPKLAAELYELLKGHRTNNPKGKPPAPTQAVRSLAIALADKMKHGTSRHPRRLAELERVVSAEGRDRVSQAYKLAHGIAKKLKAA